MDDADELVTEGATGSGERRRRWRRASRWIGVPVTLALVAGGVAWLQRTSIATGFVDRELARRGVPARYTIADVGLATQRLTDVVIGDPADPDLTADWIEIRTRVGLNGVEVRGIAVGRALVKARLTGGVFSLGAIDKLMPPPSGKPFALPEIDARLDDVRARLTTDYGQIGIKLSGRGGLNDGFDGRIAAFAYRLDRDGCHATRPRAVLGVGIAKGAPTLTGPIAADLIACATGAPHIEAPGGQVSVTLNDRLDHWDGRARQFGAAVARMPGGGVEGLYGEVSFAGDATRTAGAVDLTSKGFAVPGARGAHGQVAGRYAAGSAGLDFAGTVRGSGVAIDRGMRAQLTGYGASGAGTPVGPLLARLTQAAAVAGQNFELAADVRGTGSTVAVSRVRATSASGAHAELGGSALRFGAVTLGDDLSVGGGGLPDLRATLRQLAGGGIAGRAVVAPYQALSARLALTPVDFRASADGATSVTTTATLTGPLGDGRVDELTLPVDARWRGDTLTVNPGCAPLAWRRVAVAGLVLDPARLELCPTGAALVTLAKGKLGGGARIGATRLTGRIGGTPLTLAASGGQVGLGDYGFSLSDVATRMGAPDRVTRIDAARVTGKVEGAGVGGRFEGAGGQIANVPLLLSESDGTWKLVGGRLTLNGALRVADAAPDARFNPMMSDDVVLTMVDSHIAATGTLRSPKGAAKVADVTLGHDLSSAEGQATLIVPGISFAEGALQPDDLTPLTFGVIAAVNGNIVGRGDIAWDAGGVTSKGIFRTDGVDLAAAFGPVSGIKGEIAFTDLLGLVSAPGQVATIATVNPGVPVENGTVRYRLEGGAKVAIERGEWPFAGGELLLEPTVMDFGTKEPRRMTFRVSGVDAGQFLQQFEFKNLNATGTFDGQLPMIFDESGGRIEGGRLVARGRGGVAYVGEITQEDVGFWGNLAFQALKALDYRELAVTMNGPLAGEMITELKFDGISQGTGTSSNFLIKRLAKLPFVFNIQVRAPFRQLIDSVQSYYDPSRLVERNLPSLIEDYNRQHPEAPLQTPPAPVPPPTAIQPTESEKRP